MAQNSAARGHSNQSTTHDIKEKATSQFERLADRATDQFNDIADQAESVANRVAEQGLSC